MIDKRRYPRLAGNLFLKISFGKFDIVTETKNISGNGAYCAVDKRLAPMTKLDILLVIPYNVNSPTAIKKIHCRGVVVRTETIIEEKKNLYYVGIYFTEIKENDRKILLSFINSHLKLPQISSSTYLS